MNVMAITPGGDLGDLARAVQWAKLITDAALPLDIAMPAPAPGLVPADIEVLEADRTGMRTEAFAQVLQQIIEGEWTARPSDLERLIDGRMPEARP